MFTKRLQKCLEFRGKKPVDLAVGCNCSRGCVSQYMHGVRVPKRQTIEKFANYLNVNPLYLMGLSNDIVAQTIRVVPDEDLDARKELTNELINISSECDLDSLKQLIKLARALKNE